MSTKAWRENNAEKMKAYRRAWYARNKKRAIARTVARRAELREWWNELKAKLLCAKCGETHPYCLEFHHEDPKKKDRAVSHAVHAGWSKERIIAEMAKCVVLCANCHRKLHWPI
jgi:hypothetical protein